MRAEALKLYVSYNQIIVRDRACDLGGITWSDELFHQGFARQPSFVAYSCLLDAGPLWLHLEEGYASREWDSYSRIIEVPLLAESGVICLENPEDPREFPQLRLQTEPGWYSLLFGQSLDHDHELLRGFLSFVHVSDARRGCRIHKHEDPKVLSREPIPFAHPLE